MGFYKYVYTYVFLKPKRVDHDQCKMMSIESLDVRVVS